MWCRKHTLTIRKTSIFIGDYPPEVLVKYRTETPREYVLRAIMSFWIAWWEIIEKDEDEVQPLVGVRVSGYLSQPIREGIEKMNNWFVEQMTTKDANGKTKMENFFENVKRTPEKTKEAEAVIFGILSTGEASSSIKEHN